MDLNKVMIIGNLTRDPELRNTPAGDSVASFGIATNRVWTNAQGQRQEAVEYHNVVAWAKLADICGQYLKKGNKVYIEGRLQTREWEGQDGIKRYRTEIVARDLIMLTPRSDTKRPEVSPPLPSQTATRIPAQEEAAKEIPTIDIDKEKEGSPAPQGQEKKEPEKGEPQKTIKDEGISIEDIPF